MLRVHLQNLLEHPWCGRSIVGLIVFNAIILGLETSQAIMLAYGPILLMIDRIILGIFIGEIGVRIFVYRRAFFVDPWSIFDLLIVLISVAPSSENFAILRVLRVLRVFRLLSAAPTLRRVIEGLLRAVPGIASVAAILGMVFYVFGVIGTQLYGAHFPEWFGTLGRTMFTLFQIMTLES
ncbi:MAG: ion transporter, partial [Pseudomonadota bacterium]